MTSRLQIGYNKLDTNSIKVIFEPCWINYLSSSLDQLDVEKELKEKYGAKFFCGRKGTYWLVFESEAACLEFKVAWA